MLKNILHTLFLYQSKIKHLLITGPLKIYYYIKNLIVSEKLQKLHHVLRFSLEPSTIEFSWIFLPRVYKFSRGFIFGKQTRCNVEKKILQKKNPLYCVVFIKQQSFLFHLQHLRRFIFENLKKLCLVRISIFAN